MAADLEIRVLLQDKASRGLKALKGKLGGVGKAAGTVMRAGVLAGGVAIAGLGALALKFGSDFQEANNIIRVGTGATGDALDALNEDFKAAFAGTPADMKTVAQATADLNTRLGLTGKPLQDMTKRFVELSRITDTDVSTNIQTVTRLFGDWSVATEDQAGSLDRLFMTSQATGIGVDKLSQLVVQFGAPLRGFGFSLDESTALLAKFEKEGVNTEAVMAGLKIGLGKLAAAGKDPQVEFAKVSEAIQNAGTIGEANAAAIELFGTRAGPDMAAAIREGRFEIDNFIAQMDAGGTGILETAKATETWQEKLKLLRNKVLVKLEPLLVGFVEQVGKLADWISDKLLPAIEEWWRKHGPAIIDFLKDVGREVGDFKRAVVPVFEKVLDVLRPLGDWFVHNKQAIKAAAAAIGAVLVVMFTAWAISAGAAAVATIAAAAPVLALLLAVALLAAGVFLLIQNFDAVKATIISWIKVVEGIPVIGEIFKATVQVIGDKIDALTGFIKGLIAFVTEMVRFVSAIFRGDWAAAWESLKELAKIALNLFLDFLQLTFFGTIKSILQSIVPWDWVKGAFNTVKDNMIGAFNDAKNGILDALRTVRDTGGAIFNTFKDGIKTSINGIIGFFNRFISGTERIINALADATNALADAINAIPGVSLPHVPTISLPRIPKLEHGGEVLRTGLAVVHEGERFSRGGGDIIITGPITVVASNPRALLDALRREAQ